MIEAIVFAAVSTLLYHLGMGFVLFLIPLQAALARKGRKNFAVAATLAVASILLVRILIQGGTGEPAATPFLIIESVTVLLLVGGLALIQLPELMEGLERFRMPRVPRLLAATALAGVVSVPVIIYLRGNEVFNTEIRKIFDSLSASMNRAFSQPDSFGVLSGAASLSTDTLMQISKTFLLRSFMFDYFFLLTFSWWLGTVLGSRSLGRRPAITRIVDFRLPDSYIWPLIGALAAVLLSLVVRLGFLEILAWNVLLIMLFLYAIAGVGIIRFGLRRVKLPIGFRWLLILAIVILAFTPRINLAFLILVPGLGVSEIWLKYRTKERSSV